MRSTDVPFQPDEPDYTNRSWFAFVLSLVAPALPIGVFLISCSPSCKNMAFMEKVFVISSAMAVVIDIAVLWMIRPIWKENSEAKVAFIIAIASLSLAPFAFYITMAMYALARI